jgi:hypothetical protein
MRIDFDNNSFIEIYYSSEDKVAIILGAKDANNHLKKIVNSAEVSIDEWNKLIGEIPVLKK